MPSIAAAMGSALRTSAAVRIRIFIPLYFTHATFGSGSIGFIAGIFVRKLVSLIKACVEPITFELDFYRHEK